MFYGKKVHKRNKWSIKPRERVNCEREEKKTKVETQHYLLLFVNNIYSTIQKKTVNTAIYSKFILIFLKFNKIKKTQ